MANYSKARRAFHTREGGFGEILEPHQTLTITGTEADAKTVARSRWDPIRLFQEMTRPCRYIIDWGWVYSGMPADNQREMIDEYVDRVEWLYQKRAELGLDHVEFFPLAKGLRRSHYEQAAETYDQLGIDRVGFYAAQTRSLEKIIRRIEQVIEVLDPEGILVIGRQAPDDVAALPQRVDGVAGFWSWKQACNLTADGYSSEDFVQWFRQVKQALKSDRPHRQTSLGMRTDTEVTSDGRR
jgi:hypothetical protein